MLAREMKKGRGEREKGREYKKRASIDKRSYICDSARQGILGRRDAHWQIGTCPLTRRSKQRLRDYKQKPHVSGAFEIVSLEISTPQPVK